MSEGFSFKILKKSPHSRARRGLLTTPHGQVQTPAFVVVATQAAVKTLSPKELKEIGVPIVLGNTYHLALRPGEETVSQLGGLHKFMSWPGPVMSDSGGFQIFSLSQGREQGVGKIAKIFPEESQKLKAKSQNHSFKTKIKPSQARLVKIREEGVEFSSPIDGSRHFFTPERSIAIQKKLGADLCFAFDECTSPLAGYDYTKKAMARTHRWAERSLNEFQKRRGGRGVKKRQALFGIVQGGEYRDLREASARFMSGLDFFGLGLGGSLGKSKRAMAKILDWTVPLLPPDKPRHLLGIGWPEDIRAGVRQGIDLFDCVWPTRLARNGTLIIGEKRLIKITQPNFAKSKESLDRQCPCYGCQNFSRAYLHHLFKANEILGPRLATLHNLTFMMNLMQQLRQEIRGG